MGSRPLATTTRSGGLLLKNAEAREATSLPLPPMCQECISYRTRRQTDSLPRRHSAADVIPKSSDGGRRRAAQTKSAQIPLHLQWVLRDESVQEGARATTGQAQELHRRFC